MRYLIPLIAVLILVACKTPEIIEYKYKSSTMLGTRTVTITKDSVVSEFNGRVEGSYQSRATTPEEWEELNTSTKGLDLNSISTLEAPSNRRATDASPYGIVWITTKDSSYQSSSFDGYDSHEKLLPLMGVIRKIASQQ